MRQIRGVTATNPAKAFVFRRDKVLGSFAKPQTDGSGARSVGSAQKIGAAPASRCVPPPISRASGPDRGSARLYLQCSIIIRRRFRGLIGDGTGGRRTCCNSATERGNRGHETAFFLVTPRRNGRNAPRWKRERVPRTRNPLGGQST